MFGRYPFGEFPFGDLEDKENRVFLRGDGDLGLSSNYVIYSATAEFATKPTDTLASQPFFGNLEQPLSFRRSLLGGSAIGVFTVGDGILEVSNTDASYDFLINSYAVDGRNIAVKLGRLLVDSYDDYFTIFSGTAADWTIDETAVHVILRDNSYKLTVPAQASTYGGTGGSDGGADLTGKRKPRAFGYVLNVEPPLVDPANLIFQVNDGPVQSIDAVYDRGSSISVDSDFVDYASLVGAPTSPGFFSTCLSLGFFKLGSSPAGTVTADVVGDADQTLDINGVVTARTAAVTTGTIVRRLLRSTSIADPAGLYVSSFTALETAQPAHVGYWLSPEDTHTIADVIGDLMAGIGGWGGFRRDGSFEVNIFVKPNTTDTPTDRYDRTDIVDIKREPLPSSLTPQPWRHRVAYQRAWTTQTDLAGSVDATRRAFVAEQFRLATASDSTILVSHPFAKDTDPIQSYFALQADAQTEATRRLALYSSGARALYRSKLPPRVLQRNLGEIIAVTYPRWDLSTGRNLTIVEISEDVKSNTFEIVAYG